VQTGPAAQCRIFESFDAGSWGGGGGAGDGTGDGSGDGATGDSPVLPQPSAPISNPAMSVILGGIPRASPRTRLRTSPRPGCLPFPSATHRFGRGSGLGGKAAPA